MATHPRRLRGSLQQPPAALEAGADAGIGGERGGGGTGEDAGTSNRARSLGHVTARTPSSTPGKQPNIKNEVSRVYYFFPDVFIYSNFFIFIFLEVKVLVLHVYLIPGQTRLLPNQAAQMPGLPRPDRTGAGERTHNVELWHLHAVCRD